MIANCVVLCFSNTGAREEERGVILKPGTVPRKGREANARAGSGPGQAGRRVVSGESLEQDGTWGKAECEDVAREVGGGRWEAAGTSLVIIGVDCCF